MAIAEQEFAKLGESILLAKPAEATESFCSLLKNGCTPEDLVLYTFEQAGPHLHVPYHLRYLPNGSIDLVPYDHTVLSFRAALHLMESMPAAQRWLPLAQSMWYTPQGIDRWGQVHGKFPGHYCRSYGNEMPESDGHPPVYFEDDHEPLHEGSVEHRLAAFHRAVIEGERELSYRLFLGLAADCDPDRLEEQVLYTTLIDVQDSLTMRRNRNNQHKALLTRALFDLSRWVGWERAHPLFYTIVPDLACGPRYYSVYDMVGMSGEMKLLNEIRSEEVQLATSGRLLVSAVHAQDPWSALRDNTLPLSDKEIDETIDIVLHADNYYLITDHLINRFNAGKSIQSLADTVTLAITKYVYETAHPKAYAVPGHAMDYCNNVNYFIRRFNHPMKAKLVFLAAIVNNDTFRYNELFGYEGAPPVNDWETVSGMASDVMLREISDACDRQNHQKACTLSYAYVQDGHEPEHLFNTLALAGLRWQNDPHIFKFTRSSIEEYRANTTSRRVDIIVALARYVAGCVKRAETFDCYEMYNRHFAA
jgi:hypothetical protein